MDCSFEIFSGGGFFPQSTPIDRAIVVYDTGVYARKYSECPPSLTLKTVARANGGSPDIDTSRRVFP